MLTSVLGLLACEGEVTPPEANPFLGTWTVTELDGVPSSPGTWSFGATSVTIDYGTVFSGTYVFDDNASPASIDLNLQGQPPSLAIYRFAGETVLTLKVLDGATQRATDFTVESDYDLLTLSRTP